MREKRVETVQIGAGQDIVLVQVRKNFREVVGKEQRKKKKVHVEGDSRLLVVHHAY